MKSALFIFLLCLFSMAAIAQIPNGNFEEWETMDTIENPLHWETNNFYVSYTPVLKVEDAIAGNYSMKISSTARDIFGTATWPGCAHVKFMPTEIYQYMTASVRIDSIIMGEIEFRVKQRSSDGFFEKIGGWKRSTVSNGVINIWFPIEYTQLDTIMVEIWAFNKDVQVTGNTGYSEAIMDNLSLTNTVASQETFVGKGIDLLVSPNPAKDFVTVRLDQAMAGQSKLRLIDLQGRVRQEDEFQNLSESTLDVSGLQPGIYLFEMSNGGVVVQRTKLVVIEQ